MKFNKIVIIDNCGITQIEMDEISKLSIQDIKTYDDVSATEDELVSRIGDADCILVSWRTQITSSVLNRVPLVKYIGMCCSLYDKKSSNVDINTAENAGIAVKGVRDYGDEGTVEFIFSQLISLFKGYEKYKWREEPHELKGKSIGIVGMGTLGRMIARTALHFGMIPYYYSRTRKLELESEGILYKSIELLSAQCDIITTHLPKNTIILTKEIFLLKKENSILINTSLGPTYNKEALVEWLEKDKSSFAIFDMEGAGSYIKEFESKNNIIVYPFSSGSTIEAKRRLSQKVLDNLKQHLNES